MPPKGSRKRNNAQKDHEHSSSEEESKVQPPDKRSKKVQAAEELGLQERLEQLAKLVEKKIVELGDSTANQQKVIW